MHTWLTEMLPAALVWLPLLSQAVPESGIGARQWTRNAMLPPVLFSRVTRAQGSRVSAIVRASSAGSSLCSTVCDCRAGGCSDMEEPDINKPANSGQWSGRHVTAWVRAWRDYWSGRPPQSMGEVAR